MKKKIWLVFLVFLLFIIPARGDSWCDFSGTLVNYNTGDLLVLLYPTSTCTGDTSLLWNETYANAVKSDGDYFVRIGGSGGLNVTYNQDYYLCPYFVSGSMEVDLGGPFTIKCGYGEINLESINTTALNQTYDDRYFSNYSNNLSSQQVIKLTGTEYLNQLLDSIIDALKGLVDTLISDLELNSTRMETIISNLELNSTLLETTASDLELNSTEIESVNESLSEYMPLTGGNFSSNVTYSVGADLIIVNGSIYFTEDGETAVIRHYYNGSTFIIEG